MDKHFRLGCVVVLALSSASCGSPTSSNLGVAAQAITSGVSDDTDTFTVLIVAKVNGSTGFCSGVIVSPHVVLTAAHCASADAKYSVFLGSDYDDPAERAQSENVVEVIEHHPHPKHDTSSNTNDVGVLVTATPLSPTPALLNRKPLKTTDVGQSIRIVGYGQTSGSSKAMGRRMKGETTIAALDKTSLVVKGLPNICLFDSGGPTFMTRDGQDVIVGIHFIIDSTECNGQGADVRVDAYTDFVDGYVTALDPPAEATAADVDAGLPADATAPGPTTTTGAPASGCAIGGARQSAACSGLYGLLASLIFLRRRSARRRQSKPCG